MDFIVDNIKKQKQVNKEYKKEELIANANKVLECLYKLTAEFESFKDSLKDYTKVEKH